MKRLASLSEHRLLLLALSVCAGLLASFGAWYVVEAGEEERIVATFRRRAENQARVVRERIRLYEEMVLGLRNLFVGSSRVTRVEFERAAETLLERHPGVQALEWVAYVRDDEREAFEAAARADYPGFTIREPDGRGGLRPAGSHPEYTVIHYAAPLAGNEAAIGYANSLSPAGPMLAAARRERRLTVTNQFRLAQARSTDDELGVLFVQPVFDPERAGDGFRGFVQGVFRVKSMLAQSHRARPDEALLIYYTDLDAPAGSPAILYTNLAGDDAALAAAPRDDAAPSFREVIELGGRRWEFFVTMNPAWAARQRTWTPPLVLAGGLITTAIVVLFLRVLLRRTAEIEKQVAARTAELERTKRELEDDVQRRREAELALQASEERLEAILDNSPAAIFLKDLSGRYVFCNREFEKICERPRHEILGRTAAQVFQVERAAVFSENDRRVLAAGNAMEFEEYTLGSGGRRTAIVQKFPLRNAEGATYALCGIATDITDRLAAEKERIEFERRLQQTQKLESLGVLAGGIAHDFNNILTAVLGNATLLRAQLPAGSTLVPPVEQIENAARRAADLCSQMLAYAGKGTLSPGRVNVTNLVRDTVELLKVSVRKSTQLHLTLADRLPAVHADPTQLRQIVMNLVINAADAIGDRPGDIWLTTFAREMTREQLRDAVQHPELPAGLYVGVEVRDNGSGMAPETLARIFEPFFTTKFSGRGLGLSAVLGIVRSHDGALFVESRAGAGATFRLLLPAAGTNSRPGFPLPESSNGTKPRARRAQLSGTILLVDDEKAVREITARALRNYGLEVMEAADGLEALRLCREHPEMIDLVLLDLTMPNLSGEETLRRLRLQGSNHRAILMSGYTENDSTRRCQQLGAVAFVQKPFEIDHLLQLISEHLK